MTDDLALRIDRLEAQAAVAELVHAYARAIRRERYEDVAALFVPDGTFEVRGGKPDRPDFILRSRFEDPQALVAFLLEGKGRPHAVPLIHNLMIEVRGDTASANSVMAAPIFGTQREILGEYHDSFARHDGQWRFAARIYTVFEV